MTSAELPPHLQEDALVRLAAAVRATGYAFATVTPATHARVNARPENAWAGDLRGVFGWSRPFRQNVVPGPILDLMGEAGVLAEDGQGWRSTIRLSSLGGDLFIHSDFPTTEGDAVFFGPDTYRFAAAIRTHLEARRAPVRRAVDIGCGAGPGAVRLARAAPGAEVLMVDINERALRYATANAALAGLPHLQAQRSDLLSEVEGMFDVVVSNPPYLLDPLQRTYRHGGGALGAGLSLCILDAAVERLAPSGTLILYTGSAIVDGADHFRLAAADRLERDGLAWGYTEVDPDVFGEELDTPAYSRADRIAAVVLTVTREG